MPSIAIPVSLRGQLLTSSGFSPASIFSTNEPGIWLDPSDVANLDWRRNLLTYTEQFDNAAWTKDATGTGVAPIVTANAAVAPDGTNTADRLQFNRGAGTTVSDASRVFQFLGGTDTRVASVYLRSNDTNTHSLQLLTGSTSTTVTVTTAWQRFEVSGASGTNLMVRLVGSVGAATTADILIWGAQLELGSVATDYQRISDVNTEVLERFPKTTMYQDRAGSTAVTTPGQSVGLRLDKSKGLVLGAELVTNGDFSSGTTGWGGASATLSEVSGRLRVTNSFASPGRGRQTIATVIGRTYAYRVDAFLGSASSLRFRVLDASLSAIPTSDSGALTQNSVGTVRYFTATTTTSIIELLCNDSILGVFTEFDNISVKELPGNHAVANSDAARGIYGIEPLGGRRNLLTFTEQFDNAAWVKQSAGTGLAPVVTANAATAPDGTTTADLVAFNRGAGNLVADRSVLVQAPSGITSNTYVGSIWLKAATSGDIGKQIGVRTVGGTTYGVVTLTDDWVRVTRLETGSTSNFELASRGTITVDNQVSVHVWGAQLETGSTATAYQRVTTQYDVTEAGKQTLHYVQYDGSDDGYVTPTITPGTDKVQVFAGVRKLSDAAQAAFIGHSVAPSTNSGTFELSTPVSSTEHYNWRSRGTSNAFAIQALGYAAPITNILTSLGDISGDTATLRINGTQAAQSTTDQGTGNYLAYPLYIGRRGGTTLPFNGRDYGIITRFGANLDASTIAATESWLNTKTGAF